jgi:hypothetical protein
VVVVGSGYDFLFKSLLAHCEKSFFASDCYINKTKSMVVVPWLYIVKNGYVHEGGKVEKSNGTPTKCFSVDSYDLKSLSFKSSNDTFITFEKPRSSFLMIDPRK